MYAIRYSCGDRTERMKERFATRKGAHYHASVLRSLDVAGTYRVVRMASRGCRLERELADARRVVGPAWFAGGKSLAEAIENKCAVLERLIAPQSLATRRCFVEALLRCVRDDLPPEVDAMVRNRMLSRDGGDALTTRAAIREFSAILATWVARGAP